MKRKISKITSFLLFIATVFVMFSCDREEGKTEESSLAAIDETPKGNVNLISENAQGIYVLCEGLYGHFNSALDFYDTQTKTYIQDAFNQINAIGLGGTANDMIRVGDWLFIVVTDDAMVRVVNSKNMNVYKRFQIVNSQGVNRQPRHLVHYNGNVFVSCFDGTVVKINVNTMKIDGVLSTQGRNPEGIAINNGKLFVANSGGLGYPNYDKTVSVIDAATFTLEKVIEVGENPTQIQVFGNYVYVLSMRDYSKFPLLTKISATNYDVMDTMSIKATEIKVYGNYLYYFYKDYSQNEISLSKMNLTTMQQETFADVPKKMKMPYKISITDDIVYITDANDYTTSGIVFAFDLNGVLQYQIKTSLNPNTVIVR